MKQNKLVVFSLLALVLSSLLSCSAPATDPSPPDDAVLDAGFLRAARHDRVHHKDARIRRCHKEGHDQHHAHDGDR